MVSWSLGMTCARAEDPATRPRKRTKTAASVVTIERRILITMGASFSVTCRSTTLNTVEGNGHLNTFTSTSWLLHDDGSHPGPWVFAPGHLGELTSNCRSAGRRSTRDGRTHEGLQMTAHPLRAPADRTCPGTVRGQAASSVAAARSTRYAWSTVRRACSQSAATSPWKCVLTAWCSSVSSADVPTHIVTVGVRPVCCQCAAGVVLTALPGRYRAVTALGLPRLRGRR